MPIAAILKVQEPYQLEPLNQMSCRPLKSRECEPHRSQAKPRQNLPTASAVYRDQPSRATPLHHDAGKQGIGVHVLASLAGYRSITTTQAYIDVNDAMKRAGVALAWSKRVPRILI